MKRLSRPSLRRASAFSLVELIVVISIIALLANLSMPALNRAIRRAKSIKCASNMRQIGIAVNLAAQENNNTYPKIETDPANPVYPASDGAKSLADTLSPYGISANELHCPADAAGHWQTGGTSYEWRPMIDDESIAQPYIFRHDEFIPVSSARVRILMDIDAVHRGRQNYLFGDGRVKSY